MNLFNTHTHRTKDPDWEILSVSPDDSVSVYHSFGVHPWKAHTIPLDEISDKADKKLNDKTLAIGEIGLDRIKGPSLELQISVFIEQIELSEKEKLPVILHCVKAWNEVALIKRKLNPTQIWVFHGFAKANLVEAVLQENIVISIGTDIFTNLKLQKALSLIPNENLLLETDDSNISIQEVYQKVADLKGISLVLLQKNIEQNVKRIFPKWHIG